MSIFTARLVRLPPPSTNCPPLTHAWLGTTGVCGGGFWPQRGAKQQASLSGVSSLSGCRALSCLGLPGTMQSGWCVLQQGNMILASGGVRRWRRQAVGDAENAN